MRMIISLANSWNELKENTVTDLNMMKTWFYGYWPTINIQISQFLYFSYNKTDFPVFYYIAIDIKGHSYHIKLVKDIKYLG